MASKMVRHFDQDERQTDGAVHGDSLKSLLVKGFRKNGAENLSDSEWIDHIQQGSNKVRFEHCETSQKDLENIRAMQCHSGRATISPDLMGHVSLPLGWKEFICHEGCSFNMKSIMEHGLAPRSIHWNMMMKKNHFRMI